MIGPVRSASDGDMEHLEASMGKDGDPLLGPTKWSWTLTRAQSGATLPFFAFSFFFFLFLLFNFHVCVQVHNVVSDTSGLSSSPEAQLGLPPFPPTKPKPKPKSQEPWLLDGMPFHPDQRPRLPG